MKTQSPFDRGWVANIKMFFHLSTEAEAECLLCDEPTGETGMAV